MRYLTLAEVIDLHRRILTTSGGADGVRDLGGLESALFQPRLSVGGSDAYPSLVEKAAALGYSLAGNHPFIDGNKRIAHAAMDVFLMLNGIEIIADVKEQEQTMLQLASGRLSREALLQWLAGHTHPCA